MPHFDYTEDAKQPESDDTLGGRLTLARDYARMTLAMVARQMDVHAATLNYWEADRAAPNLQSLKKLAAILSVSPIWLLTGEGDGPGDHLAEPLTLPLVSRNAIRKVTRRPRASR
nr:helix-turn-helix transcriptional regulator [uncultured Gellertiella sp.]